MGLMVSETLPAGISISRSDLHVWRADLDKIVQSECITSLLSVDELQRAGQFIFKSDQQRYLITHSMKRLVLSHYLNCDPRSLCFEVGKRGKPALVYNPLRVQFNISHSQNIILIGVTLEDSIGVDIEYNAKNRAIEKLGDFLFSSSEKEIFSNSKTRREKEAIFFRCWTRKEAYLKAIGVGLTCDLSSISVDLNHYAPPSGNWLKVNSSLKRWPMPNQWKLFPLTIDGPYTAAIVASFFQKRLYIYNPRSLFANLDRFF